MSCVADIKETKHNMSFQFVDHTLQYERMHEKNQNVVYDELLSDVIVARAGIVSEQSFGPLIMKFPWE